MHIGETLWCCHLPATHSQSFSGKCEALKHTQAVESRVKAETGGFSDDATGAWSEALFALEDTTTQACIFGFQKVPVLQTHILTDIDEVLTAC